jgi:hypothetical protein
MAAAAGVAAMAARLQRQRRLMSVLAGLRDNLGAPRLGSQPRPKAHISALVRLLLLEASPPAPC